MGEFLGLLAGGGMLILIGVLIVGFLRQIRVLKGKAFAVIKDSAWKVLGIGCAYWAAGALINQILYGNLDSIVHIEAIFRGNYVQRMFRALEHPEWAIPLSGLSVWFGHLIGKLLFGNYILGGIVFSWCVTFFAVCLLRARLADIWNVKAAQDVVFLLLCLPGAVFLFLPGWLPLVFLLVSSLFFFIGKRIKAHDMLYSSSLYGWILAICAVFSTAVITGCVQGKLG